MRPCSLQLYLGRIVMDPVHVNLSKNDWGLRKKQISIYQFAFCPISLRCRGGIYFGAQVGCWHYCSTTSRRRSKRREQEGENVECIPGLWISFFFFCLLQIKIIGIRKILQNSDSFCQISDQIRGRLKYLTSLYNVYITCTTWELWLSRSVGSMPL